MRVRRVCLVVEALVVRVGGIEKEAVSSWNQWVGEPLAPVWNVEVRDGEAGIGPDALAVLIDEPRAGILEGFALTSGQLPNALLSRAGNR